MKCDVKICQTPATKTIRRPPTEEEFEIELDKSDDGCTFPICFIAQVCNRHYDELIRLHPELNKP